MKDFILVTIIGFLIGSLAWFPVKGIGIQLHFVGIMAVIIGCTLFAPVALWIFQQLSYRWKTLYQFGKFSAVGTLNSMIDLGILNILILATGIADGVGFILFKTLAFVGAKNNSYFWNKLWTFESTTKLSLKEYGHFVLFTSIGMILNVGVASFIVNHIERPEIISGNAWANIGALAAMLIVTLWNFFSYKHIVFK